MAKWGEGDPRWIVEERPDATNVNNWHWTEKNASPWSKERLKELLTGLTIKDDIGTCTINEVSKIDGEATANNRKCKLIFFFEWDITLDWSGFIQDDNQTYEGKIEIPNLSEENKPEEVDINVSLKKNEDNAMKLKELMRKKGASVIRQQLAQYIIELKEEFSQGLILPSKNNPGISNDTKMISMTSNEIKNVIKDKSEIANIGKLNIDGHIYTKDLKLSESFKCSPEDLYSVFTIKEMVQAFTRGPCILEAKKGGKFSLFGGNILGEFVELVPCSKIVKKWRSKKWPSEHYSHVTLEIFPKSDCVDIIMTQTGIPESDFEQTQQGWRNYYWQSIKQTFGFGARLL